MVLVSCSFRIKKIRISGFWGLISFYALRNLKQSVTYIKAAFKAVLKICGLQNGTFGLQYFHSPILSIFDPFLSPLPTLHVPFSIIIALQQDKNISTSCFSFLVVSRLKPPGMD